MALSLGIIFGPRGTRVSILSSPANTQMDSASTLLARQGPMGLGHLISRHLHRRVHPLRGHNSVFISLIMVFIFRYYLWAMRHQSIDYKLPREYTNGRCYTTRHSRPYGIGSSYFSSSTPPCSPLTWPPSYSTNRTTRRSNNLTMLNMVTIL